MTMRIHNFRFDDELWAKASEIAKREGKTITALLTKGLENYVASRETK